MSGSGLDNLTNETFDCRLTDQSNSFITNRSHWQIEEGKEVGTIITGVLVVLFFLVGTIWNLFIIITYLIKRKLLQEPANIFLLNVAITDFLICTTTMVFSFVTAFGQEYIFGNTDVIRCAICNLDGFFFLFLILVSLHLLAALSVDRFILLSRPLRYKRFMNRWRAIIICVGIYILCFIIAVLPLLGFGQIDFNIRLAACLPRFTPSRNFIFVVFMAIEALIPVGIIAVTNVWTYRLVSKFLKKNFRRKSTYRRRDEEQAATADGQKHQKQQKQLVKVFGALLIGNAISYTPTAVTVFVFLFLLLNGMEDVIPAEVYILGFISFLTSAVIHPIVESFFVKELRYQVNRARKGVRRVSTSIYRQTTRQLFGKTLDEAAKKADDDTTPKVKRPIRFLDGRIGESISAVTEMDDMTTANDASSSNSRSPIRTPEPPEIEVEENNTQHKRGKPMLDKTRKSVSFQEKPRNQVHPSTTVTPTSVVKHLPGVAEEKGTEEGGDEEKGTGEGGDEGASSVQTSRTNDHQ